MDGSLFPVLTEHEEHALVMIIVMLVFPIMSYYLRKICMHMEQTSIAITEAMTIIKNCPMCMRQNGNGHYYRHETEEKQ